MINSGDIIKHQAALDTAIQVIYALANPETGDLEVRGIWINQGQTRSFIINTNKYPAGIPAEFVIKKDQLSNWSKSLKPNAGFLRNEEWKQLE